MKMKAIEKILEETEAGYDLVAEKFSETRKFFWRDLEFIKNYAKSGDRILDFGCGNGRLLEILLKVQPSEFPKVEPWKYFGADASRKLIEAAQSRYAGKKAEFFKISPVQTSLPFADNFFNAAYAIAVFHHLPGRELRLKTARELYRVTAPGGYAVVTVWNLWQKNYRQNVFRNWQAKIRGQSELDWNDCYIGFRGNRGENFSRYHHAFTKKELRAVFSRAGFIPERCEAVGERNLIFIGQKPIPESQ